jgi:uncharacterized Ntn-hydrolase superfamily protein
MTYSIVARDPQTGEIGVAVQTALAGVGRLCPWAEAGIGAVATQAHVRTSHGPSGLSLMRNGHTAPQALAGVIAADPNAQIRQIGMVDAQGNTASHTGTSTIRYAGHRVGEGYAVQANMMAKDTVPPAMAEAFEGAKGNLMQRIIASLYAAQAEGGDFRGQQSAALIIVSGNLPQANWGGVLYDVRVDDHPEPLKELERISNRHYAYQMTDEAAGLTQQGDIESAMGRYQDAIALAPEDLQLRFWFALTMADEFGQLQAVEGVFREVFAKDPMWAECLIRYAETNQMNSTNMVDQILALRG